MAASSLNCASAETNALLAVPATSLPFSHSRLRAKCGLQVAHSHSPSPCMSVSGEREPGVVHASCGVGPVVRVCEYGMFGSRSSRDEIRVDGSALSALWCAMRCGWNAPGTRRGGDVHDFARVQAQCA